MGEITYIFIYTKITEMHHGMYAVAFDEGKRLITNEAN